jgi:hypothetical protein
MFPRFLFVVLCRFFQEPKENKPISNENSTISVNI